MKSLEKACDIETGYHPEGYRIDKTTLPMNRYTKWEIKNDGSWSKMQPVCFQTMPESGWIKVNGFGWENIK